MGARPSIAIITPGAFPVPSGKSSSVEQVVEKTAEQLAKYMRVTVIGRATSYQPRKELRSGVAYARVPFADRAGYMEAVSRLLKATKPGIIQVENRPRFVRFLRKRHPKARIVLSLHSTYFISRPHIGRVELAECLRCASLIVVNSEFLKGWLARKAPGSAHKIVSRHLGVDETKFVSRWSPEGQTARLQLLRELGVEEQRSIILFVGRLIPRKGVHHLLQAMEAIKELQPNALLLVVGSAFYGSHRVTPYVSKLHRIGNRMPLHVRFVPYVPNTDIARWYQLADVAVVPSLANEAFGLVNVEAMAAGVPVVASNSGGIQEIVAHGMTGYLAAPEQLEAELVEYISRLLADPELRRAMGEQALRRVHEQFTWRRSAELRYELLTSRL